MKKLHFHQLKDRLLLLRLEKVSDECGGWKHLWNKQAEVWGKVCPIVGRDGYHPDDLGGGMASGQGYIKTLPLPRYRVILRHDVDLDGIKALFWLLGRTHKRLKLTQHPFWIHDHQFQCFFTVEDTHEEQ